MKILILDNYDSFTYNLYHMVEDVIPEGVTLSVARNDAISPDDAGQYDKIIISPGPGLPKDAGIICEVIGRYGAEKSILGVCLGHQAIAETFGGELMNLPEVLHGKAIRTSVVSRDELLFAGCPATFETGRYHSWVVDPATLPACLQVTAIDGNGYIMAFTHQKYDVRGVQFHPESIMTPPGRQILKNWVAASIPEDRSALRAAKLK